MEVKSKALILSTILSLPLAGCGGGSSSGAPSSVSGNSGSAISGAVADGYLYGAKVCLDLNDNKRCDDDEPTTTSGSNGKYTLSGASSADSEAHGIVVEVSATTIDEDTGEAVGKAYVLTSPPGKPEFVSPLSTLVHSTMDTLKASVEDAESVVKRNLAYSSEGVSLFKDYVESGNDATYRELHKVAQIVAYIMGQNHQPLDDAIKDKGLDANEQSAAVHNLLVQHIFSQLANIKMVAQKKADDSVFSEAELATLETLMSTANIKSLLERESEIKAATTAFDVKTLLEKEGGLVSIDKYGCFGASCTNGYSYEKDTLTLSVNNDLTYEWEHSQESYITGSWLASSNHYWNNSNILIGGEWVYQNSKKTGSKQTAVNSNQVAVEPGQVISFVELNIAGKGIVPFLASSKNQNISEDIVREVAGSSASFGPGAKAYLSSAMAKEDIYQVDLDSELGSCADTTIQWVDEKTNCNVVKSGDPGAELSTIEELFSVSNDKEVSTSRYVAVLTRSSSDAKTGTATLKIKNSSAESMASTWTLKEAAPGINIVAIEIPAKMKKLDSWYGSGQTAVFFTAIDEYLRAGEFTPAGAVTEWSGYEFNSIAMEDILEQFNP